VTVPVLLSDYTALYLGRHYSSGVIRGRKFRYSSTVYTRQKSGEEVHWCAVCGQQGKTRKTSNKLAVLNISRGTGVA